MKEQNGFVLNIKRGNKMTNKTTEITRHLLEKKNITSMEAIELYGATRLSGIIYNLRRRGYQIVNKEEMTIDRYGNECRYVRYIYLDNYSDEPKSEENAKKWYEYIQKKFFGRINKTLKGLRK